MFSQYWTYIIKIFLNFFTEETFSVAYVTFWKRQEQILFIKKKHRIADFHKSPY